MTTIATYNTVEGANSAFDKLIASGFSKEEISVAATEKTSESFSSEMHKAQGTSDVIKDATGGVTSGLATGAIAGFLIGASALVLPGLGGLLVGGPLAAALGGSALAANTALGAAVGGIGGLVSGLVKTGVDEAKAKDMEQTVKSGGVILSVHSTSDKDPYSVLMDTHPAQIANIQE